MSSHHRTASKPVKSDRRVEHHRERQATRVALHVSDLEDVLDPPSVHNVEAPRSERPDGERQRRFRSWKKPFWKRRTKGHHDRDATIYHVVDQESSTARLD